MSSKVKFQLLISLFVVLYPMAFLHASETGDEKLSQAIQAQIDAASDCETIAYDIPVKNYDPEQIFASCVETRAIIIAMLKKYGVGNKGEINDFEKIQGYSYLTASSNELVQKEAQRYQTAAGIKP